MKRNNLFIFNFNSFEIGDSDRSFRLAYFFRAWVFEILIFFFFSFMMIQFIDECENRKLQNLLLLDEFDAKILYAEWLDLLKLMYWTFF